MDRNYTGYASDKVEYEISGTQKKVLGHAGRNDWELPNSLLVFRQTSCMG